jgi:hypothetical protein
MGQGSSAHLALRMARLKGFVAPLLWPSVGVKPNTWKKWDLESSGTPECSELDSKGQTPRIGVFLMSLESY